MKNFDINVPIQRVIDENPLFTTLIRELKPLSSNTTETIATNGTTLYYNSKFMEKLTEDEACATILHETLHCAFSHLWRRKERHPFVFNCAADFAINQIVAESYPLPKGSLLDSKYYGMSAEQIYEDLLKHKSKKQSWCEKDGWKTKTKKGKNKMPSASEGQEQRWKQLFEKNIARQYGKMSNSIKRVIEKDHYVPVIDWVSLVANLLSEDNADYSFSYPDRRFLGDDFILPDMYSVNKLKDVVFAFDTSGSIGKEELSSFYKEAMSLVDNFSTMEGYSAVCDCDLQSFKKFSPQEPLDQNDFSGGGGTSFQPVFDEIKKLGLSPKAVFYFTDLEGYFPAESPDYPVFWMVKSFVGDTYEKETPFGQVIKFLPKD